MSFLLIIKKTIFSHLSIYHISNELTVFPSEMNEVFKDYYSKLYQSGSPSNNIDMEKFREGLYFLALIKTKIGNLIRQ